MSDSDWEGEQPNLFDGSVEEQFAFGSSDEASARTHEVDTPLGPVEQFGGVVSPELPEAEPEISDDQTSLLDATQDRLFDCPPVWAEHWQGMPGYEHAKLTSWRDLTVHFRSREDWNVFSELVGQKLTDATKSCWYPKAEIVHIIDQAYKSENPMEPKYPIYIISKGRAESRLTAKALELINQPYFIVIEPQEMDDYAAVIDPFKILTLPFSNLGQGSIPARNWVWEDSIARGAKKHWILDDNIANFRRFQGNVKNRVGDGTIFRIAEDFVDRYENVPIAGFNYQWFVPDKEPNVPPYYLNTRVYSCILIDNAAKDIDGSPLRWRGRYNEDTDLCIRALKGGYCTILFNAFLADKSGTLIMKGGNTDELYAGDGRLLMAQSLVDQHPDIVRITEKWGRPQHQVDYRGFKRNKLRLRPDVDIPEGQDDYDMSVQFLDETNTADQDEVYHPPATEDMDTPPYPPEPGEDEQS